MAQAVAVEIDIQVHCQQRLAQVEQEALVVAVPETQKAMEVLEVILVVVEVVVVATARMQIHQMQEVVAPDLMGLLHFYIAPTFQRRHFLQPKHSMLQRTQLR
jgi:hypothetical protein